MKLIRSLINLFAMLMVLFVGALPLHAAEPGAPAPVMEHTDHSPGLLPLEPHSHSHGDPAVHCGAPILAAEPVRLSCSPPSVAVVYVDPDGAAPFALANRKIRPPRP